MDISRCLSVTVLSFIYLFTQRDCMLLIGPTEDCPNPATNCLDETFNKVFEDLGCLGCQTGCKTGYIMTANRKYYVTGQNLTGFYYYRGIPIAKSKNVSEPQWQCVPGATCTWGHFLDRLGTVESCSYCGEGCLTCHSFSKCEQCLLGFRLMRSSVNGIETAYCSSSGIACPAPPDHCQHNVYVGAVTGCPGCIICDQGYMPIANTKYRRAAENRTADYVYNGLTISGTIELYEPRYTCIQGTTCPDGYHGVNRGNIVTCEVTTLVVG
ncbi:hypothetical protein Btru_076905 [Bulinus truncatus]|nr:hypothetical protein Btru_076905 [Bulinus truncatus]